MRVDRFTYLVGKVSSVKFVKYTWIHFVDRGHVKMNRI